MARHYRCPECGSADYFEVVTLQAVLRSVRREDRPSVAVSVDQVDFTGRLEIRCQVCGCDRSAEEWPVALTEVAQVWQSNSKVLDVLCGLPLSDPAEPVERLPEPRRHPVIRERR